LPSFFATEVFRVAVSTLPMNPAEEPFLAGMSGVTTLFAT